MQFSLEYALRVNPLARGFYYVAPSFRGETPDSSHLNQFFHVECELVGEKAKAMEVAERYLMYICKKMLQNNTQELKATAGTTDHIERLLHMMEKNFNRLRSITLDEAVDLPSFKDEYWEWVLPKSPEHGRKVSRAGEKFLIEYFGGAVWLTEMDHLSVPFYQAFVQDNKAKAKCADLLLGIGETLGLGERHKTKKDIVCALDMHGVAVDAYQWYIDMRDESEGLKTSGWGIGLERFLCWLMAHDDVRDCHIIPRLKGAAFYP
jgi:aspartyl/asparaginyl-tRNA synthetase